MSIKGELFTTDMVQAFIESRKGRTSRPIKCGFEPIYKAACLHGKWSEAYGNYIPDCLTEWYIKNIAKPKYQVGDIMYCRETWRIQSAHRFESEVKIEYKAGGPLQVVQFGNREQYDEFIAKWDKNNGSIWIPSIHMPKKVARIFNLVQRSSIQRLEDMTEHDAVEDGFQADESRSAEAYFERFWLEQYGHDTKWMWAYYLKSVSKKEAMKVV